MREHLILCGSSDLTSREKVWRKVDPIRLSTSGTDANVNLRIADITDKMTAGLPDVAADLVELATYVYCADQATRRGGDTEFEYGHKWRRNFRFEIPVRRPDVWTDAKVKEPLTRTLSFLSDDDYEFAFTKLKHPPALAEYLEWDQASAATSGIEEVMLFSGGADSLGGAVEEVLTRGRKLALVSHRPVTKISRRQKDLVGDITSRVKNRKKAPFHVPVLVNKDKELGREYTQRSRSFLYASIASIVARMFGLDRVRFYENGIVSLNLPICAQVIGGRATRTTHPQVLRGLGQLFSALYDRTFQVDNPFFWKTKTDVMAGVKAAGHADLCRSSVSCTHTWEMTKLHTHCGRCSQCIDRRLAALSAGLTDAEDPPEMYKMDVLKEGRDEPEYQTMIERMVGTANEVEAMHDATQFGIRFGELSRVLRYIDGSSDSVAQKIFELHQRHAKQVCRAIDGAGTALVSELRRKTLPGNCLLSIALGPKFQARIVADAASAAEAEADANGYVRSPADPTAYVPASEIIAEHSDRLGYALSAKMLGEIVERYETNNVRWSRPVNRKTGTPMAQRRTVHLNDWLDYVKRLTSGGSQVDRWPSMSETEIERRKLLARTSKERV